LVGAQVPHEQPAALVAGGRRQIHGALVGTDEHCSLGDVPIGDRDSDQRAERRVEDLEAAHWAASTSVYAATMPSLVSSHTRSNPAVTTRTRPALSRSHTTSL